MFSLCSAHPLVVRAAWFTPGAAAGTLLIESTCNQVNQDGGYTGMTARDFIRVRARHCDPGTDPARINHPGRRPPRSASVAALAAEEGWRVRKLW
jgi:D-tagatose-1,6-bisphosphate aldolase subunit GatZ/KbaZ